MSDEHARLLEVFRQSPSFLAVLRGPENVFELVNDAYHRIVGHRDVLGKPLFEAMPDLRGQGFEAFLARVRETGEPLVFRELPVVLQPTPGAPPEERFVDITYLPLVDADGTREAVVAHGTDVTDQVTSRRDAEAANEQLREQAVELEAQAEELQSTATHLEELMEVGERARTVAEANEARYRALTEAVPVQVWTALPDGQLDFVSARTTEYFGASTEAVLGSGWGVFVHPDDLAVAVERWMHALATGTPYQTEFRLREGATGEYRWHLARALPVRDAAGAVTGWVGSNTNVDDERRARAEAEAARVIAEAANRAKSEFLAVMSHELRTPLNAIGGYTELLELGVRGAITPEQRTDLERIQRSQRHLLGLINGVLNYAKLDAGAVHFEIADVPLDEVLATCESFVTPQAHVKRLAVTVVACDPALRVRADRDKLQQVVLNLLSNAVKFTDPGGRVTVSCEAAGARVHVRVADTGRGIRAEQLERVFEPFVQIDSTLTRTSEGTGLGLAISRDLARGMDGELTAESVPGMGSTFTLTLARG